MRRPLSIAIKTLTVTLTLTILLLLLPWGDRDSVASSHAGGLDRPLQFGLITAISETTAEETIYLPKEEQPVSTVEIFLTAPFRSRTSSAALPAHRLAVMVNEKRHELSRSPLTVHLPSSADLVGDNSLRFAITVCPEDPPGLYTAMLELRTGSPASSAAEAHNYQIPVTVEVAGWIRLKADTQSVSIKPNNPSYPAKSMNQFPCTLQIAANVPWELYGSLDAASGGIGQAIRSRLIPTGSGFYRTASAGGVKMTGEPVCLAQGVPTVSTDQYWVSISIVFEIEDATQYPAGVYALPFNVTAWERKP